MKIGNGEDNGTFVTNKVCCERRDALKSEAWARADAIKIATSQRDHDIEKLEERINQLIILILGQLVAFILGIILLIFSGRI